MTGDAAFEEDNHLSTQTPHAPRNDRREKDASPCEDDNAGSEGVGNTTDPPKPTEHQELPRLQQRDNANKELDPIDIIATSGDSSDGLSPPPSSPPVGFDDLELFNSPDQPNGRSTPTSGDGDGDGRNNDDSDNGHDRPAKRRKLRPIEVHPVSPSASRRHKPESPPWRKIEASGPTTIIHNGRRKSGRINANPVEMQPPPPGKRPTRGAKNTLQSSPIPKKTASPKKQKIQPTRISTRKAVAEPTNPGSKRARSPITKISTPPRRSTGTRRSSRNLQKSPEETPSSQPRIRLRLRTATIPITHPEIIPRPKTAASFEEYFSDAAKVPVEEGGLWASEDCPEFTDEMAQNEAEILLRIEDEAGPGGLLSEGKCSAFVPEPPEECPPQWAHYDHLIKAGGNFRRLMVQEHQRHRQAAKKMAEACRDHWLRKQPKSAEQLEAEAKDIWIGRYKGVSKALVGTWENVRTEINRRRVEEWKMQEEKRVKAALNQAVNMSEQKLQARRAHFGSDDELETDIDEEEGEGESEGDGEEEDDELGSESGLDGDIEEAISAGHESNMSSSEDEAEDKGDQSDEELDQEQLRQKYSGLPGLESNVNNNKEEEVEVAHGKQTMADTQEGEDTSDESVDMDDDLGSSDDMDSEDDGNEEDDEDDDDDDEANNKDESRGGGGQDTKSTAGILGLLFGKSELKQMQVESAVEDEAKESIEKDEGVEDTPVSANGENRTISGQQAQNGSKGLAITTNTEPITNANGSGDKLDSGSAGKVRIVTVGGGGDEEVEPANGVGSSTASFGGQTAAIGKHVVAAPTPDIYPSMAPSLAANGNGDALLTKATVNGDIITSLVSIQNSSVTVGKANGVGKSHEADDIDNVTVDKPTTPTVVVAPVTREEGQPVVGEETVPSCDAGEAQPVEASTNSSDDADAIVATTPASPSGTDIVTSRSVSDQPGGAKTEIPFLLRGTLREYQHHGLDWLAGLYANKTNGILADEMGLGKTIQTIALIAHLACVHEVWGPHLVIVPTSVMLNWEMEFKKWCPGFKILSYYGSIEERKRKRQGWTNDDVWNVCITSYQLVLADQQVFKRRRWHYMILDEAHNIKNFKSQRWQTLLGFNAHSRLLLTGTPLQNNLTELWSLLFFLMPPENGVGGFADLQEFQDWFHRPEAQILESGRDQMDDEARAIIQKLHKVLRPYLLRRLKADVEKQMPAKHEHVEFCRLSKRQRELYDGFLARTETRETLASGNYLSIINCLMQLRKVCNHPDLFHDRPIMTSFRMRSSIPSEYHVTHNLVRTLLGDEAMNAVNMGFLNLIPTQYEHMSAHLANRIVELSSNEQLMEVRQAQRDRAENGRTDYEPATVLSNISYLESTGRWGRFEELQHCVYLNALRRQQKPIYGKHLISRLTIGIQEFPRKPRPVVRRQMMAWFEEESSTLNAMVQPLSQRADALHTIIQKFACVTPAVVTRDMPEVILGRRGIEIFTEADLKLSAPVRYAPFIPPERPLDPWHESRMRLSIQFPDKRLLQYDCGKLQALDRLLRRLGQGGHRALIFTQMTKVLDILEQFLNIHGHKYLRLDGATKIEQRQIMTDRFNHDPRILCFILSTRSGGLGINLTGADTVIFYDQDWNPAMDKQCQDRCHRIGQTRDVHIYRLISEHTIEANILRKASQKQMLDDVVIQEGDFTTDYFTKLSVQDIVEGEDGLLGNMAANEAMDRLLGQSDNPRSMGKVLEQAEDKEDVQAAHVAEKEIMADDADFMEKPGSGAPTRDVSVSRVSGSVPPEGTDGMAAGENDVGDGDGDKETAEYNAWGVHMKNIDDFMLRSMMLALEDTPLELPKQKRKGRDRRKR